MTTPDPFAPGYRLTDGNQLNDRVANPQWSTTSSISATPGGTMVTSAAITDAITNITNASVAGAGLTLPQALLGTVLIVSNNSANDVRIFAEGNSTIDGLDGAIGIILAKGTTAIFTAVATKQWSWLNTSANAGITTVQTINALRHTTVNSFSAMLVEGYYTPGDGGGGYFYGVTGAAPGTYVDNGGTIIVPGDGSSAWIRNVADAVSVKMFGAKGDGVTSDTAAFNRTIAWANSKGGSDRPNIKGTTIIVPEGRFVIDAALTPIVVSQVIFEGVSTASAVLLITAPGNVFTFGDATQVNDVVGGGVTNLRFEYPTLPTGNAVLFNIDYAFGLVFTKLDIFQSACIAKLGNTTSRIAGGIRFDLLNVAVANIGVPAFKVNYGAGLYISNSAMFVSGVITPVNPNSMTTVYGTSVFDISKTDGFWDTIQVSNCIFERFDVGLGITSGAGCVFQNMFFTGVIMDYFRRWPVYLQSSGTGSVISGIKFDVNCWFVSWEESGIYINNSGGYNDNHSFSGVIPIAGKYGVYFSSSNSINVSFDNLNVNGCNRLGTVSAALFFQAGSTGFFVTNCRGNNDTSLWTRPVYGLQILADCDAYSVTNNGLYGASGGYFAAVNSAGSSNRRINNNINANYAVGSTTSVPASNVSYTNTTPFTEEWVFSQGTITGGYSKNGVGISGGLQSLTLTMQPGDYFSVGYSSAPSATKFVQP